MRENLFTSQQSERRLFDRSHRSQALNVRPLGAAAPDPAGSSQDFVFDACLLGTARSAAVAMTSSDLGADRELAALGTDCGRVGGGGV